MLQQIINILYRYPKSALKRYARFGGYLSYRRMLQGRNQMQRMAANLPPVKSHPDGLPIYFLTGRNYLYQTLFCIQSLVRTTSTPFKFVLVDDGSFNHKLLDQIKKQLPGATIISREAIEQNLNQILPTTQFPVLRNKRNNYPHLKKLTDIHTIPGNDWKLVIDSDMLFWQEPDAMLKWLAAPTHPLHMVDCVESYGYSKQLMQQLAGEPIPALLNVGTIGLSSNEIPWQKLEDWVEVLERQEGKTYYLEQALTAMLIGSKPAVVLNAEQYVVNPSVLDDGNAVLHHYVDISKKIYFMQGWKKIL